MVKISETPSSGVSDAQLVGMSLSGDRHAFGEIVTRYQTLVCSLAYNATGNLAESEDLSQETFLAAWKQLSKLREPEKLRSWLCAIVRNLGNRLQRSKIKESGLCTEKTEGAQHAAVDPLPPDQAVSAEEEAIMWRALERIPDVYREPLILFYREHQSIERVAQVLELSEEVVRQRLSRGRKLLRDEVAAFVTGALARSNPKPAFASAVLAAIPAGSGGLATGAASAKAAGLLPWLTLPALGILASLAGSVTTVRNATSEDERKSKKRLVAAMWVAALALAFAQEWLRFQGTHGRWTDRRFVHAVAGGYLLWTAVVTPLVIIYIRRYVAGIDLSEYTGQFTLTLGKKLRRLLGNCATIIGSIAWLIDLAREVHDTVVLSMVSAVTVGLIAWQCILFFGTRRIALLPISWHRLAWIPTIVCVGTILLVLDCRLDRWVAIVRGRGVADAQAFLPQWIVLGSTLLVIGWAALMTRIIRPKKIPAELNDKVQN